MDRGGHRNEGDSMTTLRVSTAGGEEGCRRVSGARMDSLRFGREVERKIQGMRGSREVDYICAEVGAQWRALTSVVVNARCIPRCLKEPRPAAEKGLIGANLILPPTGGQGLSAGSGSLVQLESPSSVNVCNVD
jgi:hypothetical protein